MKEHNFYHKVLKKLTKEKIIKKSDSILVICGGIADKEALIDFGFNHVTISNLDERMSYNKYKPYDWSFQDAENLQYENEKFDYVFVQAGLHHCRSPHTALCEMYRVAKKGMLVIEARDSISVRLACFLCMSEEYEISAVIGNGRIYGGIRNSGIPNYVYRWTEREIKKAIQSYAPHAKHYFRFYYSLRLPYRILPLIKHFILRAFVTLLFYLLRIFTLLFRGQCNEFAALIMKPNLPKNLQPWLEQRDKTIVIKNTIGSRPAP